MQRISQLLRMFPSQSENCDRQADSLTNDGYALVCDRRSQENTNDKPVRVANDFNDSPQSAESLIIIVRTDRITVNSVNGQEFDATITTMGEHF
jgi:hypothetical protein